jgi:hypothetical protein
MNTSEVLTDAFNRIQESVHRAADGLDGEALAYRPDPDANSIAWLLWHLTRTQDHHVSELAGRPQAWLDDGWSARFTTDPHEDNTGFGHTSEQVAEICPDVPDDLVAYHDVVAGRTLEYLGTIDAEELGRIIDRSWDPPVSVGVRLVSVINDNVQHVGQALYVTGMIERLG